MVSETLLWKISPSENYFTGKRQAVRVRGSFLPRTPDPVPLTLAKREEKI